MKRKSEKLVASCSPVLKSQIGVQARREGESVAFIIRKAVRLYLQRIKGHDNALADNQGE